MERNKLMEIVKVSVKGLKNRKASKDLLSTIEELNSIDIDSQNIEKLIIKLCQCAFVPNTDYEKDLPDDYFQDYVYDSTIVLQILLETFNIVIQDETDLKIKISSSAMVHVLIVCANHSEPFEWTSDNSRKLSERIIQCAILYYGVKSWEDLFVGNSNGLAKPMLVMIMPRLAPDIWKENPAFKYVFKWILHRVKHPHLLDLLPEVLPPSLLFIDDYVIDNKILGVQCVQHIILNINSTELKWFGRAEVIYSALEHLTYSREAELIPVLYPCILEILSVMETAPTKSLKFNRYDKVLGILLMNMETEQKLSLRTAFAAQLPKFIETLQITVVKHMKQLLRVFELYLEVHDNPEEITRKSILVSLQCLLVVAWPRIPFHMESILKCLLKFVYDLEGGEVSIPLCVKTGLINEVDKCMVLLKMTSPDKFEKLVMPLTDEEIQKQVKKIALRALEAKDCISDKSGCKT